MDMDDARLLEVYELLATARQIERALTKYPGYHPAIGEEAVIVGAFGDLRADDYIAPHYRGALLAAYLRGGDLGRLIAGMLGKATGYNRGRFRGDVSVPFQLRAVGAFAGLLGGSVGIATGIALSLKLRSLDSVAVATFGDGTSNLGAVHESMNLAASLSLPIVYVCQNNGYAMSTRSDHAMKCRSVADRAAGYGMPGAEVDGNDVLAVHAAVQAAVARARAGNGPSLIEARTYRISGHFSADPARYQIPAEREEWLRRDPLAKLRAQLTQRGLLTEARAAAIDAAVEPVISAAVLQAERDPEPGPEALGVDAVYAPAASVTGAA